MLNFIRKTGILIYFIVISCVISSAQKSKALTDFLKKENLIHAAIGFNAVDLKTGKCIASYNENVALSPASNMKIVTTATALDIYGNDFRYKTPLLYTGSIRDSILSGNLYIQGTGDPTLGSEFIENDKEDFLKEWLSAIRKAGIKAVSGDIVALDQLFGYEGVSMKWLLEDIGTYYAPGIYGISVFDNMYRVNIQSFAPGKPTKILFTEPEMKDLHFTNEILASDTTIDYSYIFGMPFSNDVRLYGNIPANRNTFTVKGALPDPGLFLAQYFLNYLQNKGLSVNGKASTYRLCASPLPDTLKKIGLVYSPDLAEITKEINVHSNNHYAEHLYKKMLLLDSINIRAYWQNHGLDSTALIMFDGSGVSPQNAVTTRFLTDILIYMDKKADGQAGAFYQSLPVAGKNGTVSSFLKNTPLAGKVHLKSGSITNVQSFSGYVEKGDKRYAFSLIVNNFTGKRKDLREAIEDLLVELF